VRSARANALELAMLEMNSCRASALYMRALGELSTQVPSLTLKYGKQN
jgi:hypothetical protein